MAARATTLSNAQTRMSSAAASNTLYAAELNEDAPIDLAERRRIANEIDQLMKILAELGAEPELWHGNTVVSKPISNVYND